MKFTYSSISVAYRCLPQYYHKRDVLFFRRNWKHWIIFNQLWNIFCVKSIMTHLLRWLSIRSSVRTGDLQASCTSSVIVDDVIKFDSTFNFSTVSLHVSILHMPWPIISLARVFAKRIVQISSLSRSKLWDLMWSHLPIFISVTCWLYSNALNNAIRWPTGVSRKLFQFTDFIELSCSWTLLRSSSISAGLSSGSSLCSTGSR